MQQDKKHTPKSQSLHSISFEITYKKPKQYPNYSKKHSERDLRLRPLIQVGFSNRRTNILWCQII